MNGIVPPASKGKPLANPVKKCSVTSLVSQASCPSESAVRELPIAGTGYGKEEFIASAARAKAAASAG
jgi:hypothetical protein